MTDFDEANIPSALFLEHKNNSLRSFNFPLEVREFTLASINRNLSRVRGHLARLRCLHCERSYCCVCVFC